MKLVRSSGAQEATLVGGEEVEEAENLGWGKTARICSRRARRRRRCREIVDDGDAAALAVNLSRRPVLDCPQRGCRSCRGGGPELARGAFVNCRRGASFRGGGLDRFHREQIADGRAAGASGAVLSSRCRRALPGIGEEGDGGCFDRIGESGDAVLIDQAGEEHDPPHGGLGGGAGGMRTSIRSGPPTRRWRTGSCAATGCHRASARR